MKICFTGDVFLGGDLLNKPCDDIIKVDIFNEADSRVINLEQPISDNTYIEDKCTLYTGSYAINQLKDLRVGTVNLAHNHIQDKGPGAISETIDHLNLAGIRCFGAGKNILEAQKPCWLTNDIAIFGYCEFDKPYLKQIVVADTKNPGINPLRINQIKHDLNQLPSGAKAVLYFHWGMEHVWLPPYEDIALAKKLLEDNRVITIIGMHAHRAQGIVNHAGKTAYMCLGNFMFPNFHIKPPVQISYPSTEEKREVQYITRQYHTVFEPTYKKWRLVNRVSLVIDFCTKTYKTNHVLAVQDDNLPVVRELDGLSLFFFKLMIAFLTLIYRLPKPLYKYIWKIHAFEVKLTWRVQIRWFYLKQIGLKKFISKVLNGARKKLR